MLTQNTVRSSGIGDIKARRVHGVSNPCKPGSSGLGHGETNGEHVDKIGQLGGLLFLAIAELHPVTMQDLVRHVAKDKSQVTRLVQMMEERRVIARTPSPKDGRVTLLHPREKGCAFMETTRTLMSDVIDEVLVPLPAKDRTALDRILREI